MNDQPIDVNVKPWERDVIEKMLFETLKEQKRNRRWRIFFRLIFLALILLLIYFLMNGSSTVIKAHSAVIRIEGSIADDNKASSDNIIKGVRDAFEDSNTKGIILKINSPGGSPVQAYSVYSEIMRLRQKYPNIKVYAVCRDLCASAAYYIAAAANDIYAEKASLVGSIGVLMDGFGFVDTLQKVGVTRRLFTAGSEKGFMDPFSALKETDVQHVQTMLDLIHKQFINAVKEGRGKRLKENDLLFSGLIWTGEQAIDLGLIDGFGGVDYVAKHLIKEENLVDYTTYGDFLQRFTENLSTQFSRSVGAALGIQPGLLR